MLSTRLSYKYHIYAHCSLYEIPINRILHLKLPCTYTDFCSILYLDAFSVHLTIESHVTMLSAKLSYKYHIHAHCSLYEIPINRILYLKYHVKYTGLVQSYTWNYFHSIFLRNLMFTMLSTHISYKYHIYAQYIL